jgi:hypothetical protein
MIMNLCRMIEDETPSAIGAVGFTRLTDRQIDHGMTERAATAIAPDSRRFHVNDLGWLHLRRSLSLQKSKVRNYLTPVAGAA